ncbi:MAG: nicotinamide N-methylase [Tistrella sp.]|uniref:class I SAM-dependent methyltransferase n=1 Tax=Tistrella mobilis TaxID=171437 RepID=UPI000C08EB05|nr:50S ribosomal protein L11 methyltransferase [uncultured Tistrella sp.]MAM76220.1 nicotinamide N-methylase [Tistrella sp.]
MTDDRHRSGLSTADAEAFVAGATLPSAPPLLPEIRLHLASEVTPLWEATETRLADAGLPPPFWAFAWAGGQAVARLVLDRPELVRGRRVMDFATGGGVAAIAAALAGAARVDAVDIDPFATAAARLNARINGAEINTLTEDLVGQLPPPGRPEIVMAGDVCYEKPMAERVFAWLRALAGDGVLVLLGDPARAYAPRDGVEALAVIDVPTVIEIEDKPQRRTTVWRVLPAPVA